MDTPPFDTVYATNDLVVQAFVPYPVARLGDRIE